MTPTARNFSWRFVALVLLACDPQPAERPRDSELELERERSEVIFSPQPPPTSHNARVAERIAGARRSIDVAMYSFANAEVEAALADAAARGVTIRFIFDDAPDKSRSPALEAAGIDVRYVNPVMHHKFMIVDGPRDELDAADTAYLVTGSGNWSDAAATRYDENTLFLRGHEELTLRFQREFNYLWEHSRDFVGDEDLQFGRSALEITDADIDDQGDVHALFTSANFDLADPTTFSTTERSAVSDALIAAIADARASIWVASGHLRHRGISEALIAKALQQPDLDIRVYLDAQEYVSEWAQGEQVDELEDCLEEAGVDEPERRDCLATGFRFGYAVAQAGVDVRYKYYSYRWFYGYAKQMHHKYLIIDGDELWTGSYNLSDNAEHHTMENIVVFRGPEQAALIDAYEANFSEIWETGRGELARLREEIASAEAIPLVFGPIALEWEEVGQLKALIRANCPRVDTPEFRSEPGAYLVCERRGGDDD